MEIPATVVEERARPVPRPAAWQWWARAGRYAVRAGLALAVVIAWAQTGLPTMWQAWQAARTTPAAAGRSYDDLRMTLSSAPLHALLAAARAACPPARPVLALSDDPIAMQQGNYILYPRRVILVPGAAPFDAATLAPFAGGCVFFYGPQGGRLDPFRARLTEITCSPSGCLYRVLSDE
jgi:hypothetical protein